MFLAVVINDNRGYFLHTYTLSQEDKTVKLSRSLTFQHGQNIIKFMKVKYSRYLSVSVLIAMFIVAVYFYPMLPERIATHFGPDGVPNGFMGKFWGLFLLPLVSLVLYILFLIIPYIDPLKKNIEEFRDYYDILVFIFMTFFLYLELGIVLWNVGFRINMTRFVTFPIGILYIYLGILLLKSRRNWFVGIRTPWTLTNDRVWEKTNKLGGWLFIIDGILVILSFFTGKFMMFFMVWFVLAIALFLIVYSYFLWKKFEGKEGKA